MVGAAHSRRPPPFQTCTCGFPVAEVLISQEQAFQESLFGFADTGAPLQEGNEIPFDWLASLKGEPPGGGDWRKRLFLGTCSWKYPEWKGLLYGPEFHAASGDFLRAYSHHLNSVEVDQWFWSLFPGGVKMPDPADVRHYRGMVPDGFQFTVKAPNSITLTHFYGNLTGKGAAFANQPNPDFLSLSLLHQFLESLEPLSPALGPILFQFEYLNRTKMPSLERFMDALGEFFSAAPTGYRYAIEVRNPEYLGPEWFAFLEAHGLAPILVEGNRMPPLSQVLGKLTPTSLDDAVVRLMGWDRALMESLCKKRYDRIVAPQPESLAVVAGWVRQVLEQGRTVFLNFNNHYEGCAPLSIRRFLEAFPGKNPGTDGGIPS